MGTVRHLAKPKESQIYVAACGQSAYSPNYQPEKRAFYTVILNEVTCKTCRKTHYFQEVYHRWLLKSFGVA